MTRLPDQNFRKRHAFVFSLVRQHRTGDHIADGPDARNIGRIVVINNDASAFIQLDAELLETQPLGVRHSADRDQNDIGLDRFGRAALRRLYSDLEPFPEASTAVTFEDNLNVMPCFSNKR